MDSLADALRRVLAGREVGIAFAALLAGSLLVGSFVPWYLAVAFASGVRNTTLAWLGNGPAFYAVAVLALYVQAVVAAGGYRVVRRLHRRVGDRRSDGPAG